MRLLIPLLFIIGLVFTQERVLIEGEAEYTFSDNETLIEAKSLCYNMALRNAVESYQIFISSMTEVQNWQLRNDIIQTMSTGYLEDLSVVDEKIDKANNSIYYKLKAYIKPEPFKRALKQQVSRKVNFTKPAPVKDGKYLTILSVKEETEGSGYNKNSLLKIIYKKKNPRVEGYSLPSHNGVAYEDSMVDSEAIDLIHVDYIKLTFLDNDGIPYDGKKYPTKGNLQEGEIRALKVKLPDNYGSYEIWITK